MKINTIQLNQIPTDKAFQGYIWMSDKESPEIYFGISIPKLPAETDNPFIIEGNLYDSVAQISYSIRFSDGAYIVNSFELAGSTVEFSEKSYIPNRIPGIQALLFRQYWKEVKDEFCEGMEVLKPTANVFIGFKSKEE